MLRATPGKETETMDNRLAQMERRISELVVKETQNYHQLQWVSKMICIHTMTAGVAALTGLALVAIRLVQLLGG